MPHDDHGIAHAERAGRAHLPPQSLLVAAKLPALPLAPGAADEAVLRTLHPLELLAAEEALQLRRGGAGAKGDATPLLPRMERHFCGEFFVPGFADAAAAQLLASHAALHARCAAALRAFARFLPGLDAAALTRALDACLLPAGNAGGAMNVG